MDRLLLAIPINSILDVVETVHSLIQKSCERVSFFLQLKAARRHVCGPHELYSVEKGVLNAEQGDLFRSEPFRWRSGFLLLSLYLARLGGSFWGRKRA